MKELDISVCDTEKLSAILKDSLSIFKEVKNNKIYTSKDMTTVEYKIIKVAEKLCQMKEVPELIH